MDPARRVEVRETAPRTTTERPEVGEFAAGGYSSWRRLEGPDG